MGKKCGLGEYHKKDDFQFIGTFKNDLFHGFGIIIYSDGS